MYKYITQALNTIDDTKARRPDLTHEGASKVVPIAALFELTDILKNNSNKQAEKDLNQDEKTY